ncbi:GNAT family N-acetyltransferase [Saccharomonospora azurea]|jgi:RimJ/RimL family protein N-acetyltransferase|uniref:Acetyltransferase, ribosomal protein N-acetylase n=1 Tax=Saccharomonospora azurea NA-128 TaxID=882081 RepID=H8GD50_9PSEU|nr:MULTISPECIES: GNAT family N-acetyltransferase [Saccharomonospora]EHY88839.1 acetyltransferase, ribosomal protein N-acetylase [Saccharomonospora azurea NA-128]
MLPTGELVQLRPLEPDDADHFWRWHKDPDVVRWMTGDYHLSLAQTRARFAERKRNSYSELSFVVETLADGTPIGGVRLDGATPETACAEVSLYLGRKDYWGRGYGTDALRTVCRYGFDVMRLHSIVLWVVPENDAAVRLYRKVGFREDGRQRDAFRGAGRWHDMILMTLLEGELT